MQPHLPMHTIVLVCLLYTSISGCIDTRHIRTAMCINHDFARTVGFHYVAEYTAIRLSLIHIFPFVVTITFPRGKK